MDLSKLFKHKKSKKIDYDSLKRKYPIAVYSMPDLWYPEEYDKDGDNVDKDTKH